MAEKTYELLNYNEHAVAVSSQTRSFLFEKGSKNEPYGLFFTKDEIREINYRNPQIISTGMIVPAKADAEEIYTDLRIADWKDILSNEEIEDIILHPTSEGIKNILRIKSASGFNRIYSILVMLTNAFADVPNSSAVIIKARREEIAKGINPSEIKITEFPKDVSKQIDELKTERESARAESEKLKAEMAALKAELESLKKEAKKTTAKKTEG